MSSFLQKFRLKLKKKKKKKRKTSRPFRYDLSQSAYTMEMMNRYKGLDLLDRVLGELWTEVCNIVKQVVTKTIPMERK